MPVREDPECVGQVPRLASYQHAHPDVEIFWMGTVWSCWQGVIREDDDGGMTIITRRTLRALLDRLEALALESPIVPQASS